MVVEDQSEALGVNEPRTGESASAGCNGTAGVDPEYDLSQVLVHMKMQLAQVCPHGTSAEALGDATTNEFNEMSFTLLRNQQ